MNQTSGNNGNCYDYGARYYDPAIGRWMTPDPLAPFVPGITPYHYTYNNPVNLYDPTGLWPEWWDRWRDRRKCNTTTNRNKNARNGEKKRRRQYRRNRRRYARNTGRTKNNTVNSVTYNYSDYLFPVAPPNKRGPITFNLLGPPDFNWPDFPTIELTAYQPSSNSGSNNNIDGNPVNRKQYKNKIYMIPFERTSYKLSNSFRSDAIDKLIDDLLKDPTLIIIIEGNINLPSVPPEDEIMQFKEGPLTAPLFMNRRALSVKQYLMDRGVPENQLKINSDGGTVIPNEKGYSVTINAR